MLMQKKVIWLFGLSGAGKTTIAKYLSHLLTQQKVGHILIDGDEIRNTVNKDLGYSKEDRKENIRRSAEFAKLVSQQNILCICSFITPLKSLRDSVREILQENVQVFFIDTPLEECIKRDVKGLYAKALKNEIQGFTGISDDFEYPDSKLEKDIIYISTQNKSVEECAKEILDKLK